MNPLDCENREETTLFPEHGSVPTTPADPRPVEPELSDIDPQTPAADTQARWASGTVLADRYRIVNVLGKGGMGEVYRADDLRLGETVALKFLLPTAERDDRRREALLSEARLARKVSHPNVCRVHDISVHGTEDGEELHFISMEHVEGGDLASLLRRIGRLPKAKALEISREICAGLMAVHGCGMLHRDLKPSNVMIDREGHVRLTDFGLAIPDQAKVSSAGTPAYMAPEQFASGTSTVSSDIYALGLVLYEVFTGSRAVEARSPVEYAWKHLEHTPEAPSSRVQGMDAEVERILVHCLEKVPGRRPHSVREVLQALERIDPEGATAPEEKSEVGEALRALLLCDLVGSTALVETLGDRRASELAEQHDRLARDLLADHGGREIDKTDGFLLLFEHPLQALCFALEYHGALGRLSQREGLTIAARVGIHFGDVWLRQNPAADVSRGAKPLEVEGLAKAVAARLMSLAGGGQTLLGRVAFDLARRAAVGLGDAADLRWLDHGAWRLHGVADPIDVFEVGREGQAPLAPPEETEKVRRLFVQSRVGGWRPAPSLTVPQRLRWRLRQRLGAGGFGEVWLAEHVKTGERRGFKFCFDAEHLRGLQREITLFRLLKEELGERDDINRILDWNLDEAPYFIESEYTSLGNLAEWADSEGGLGTLALETRLEIVAQVATALAAAHSVGVLHKDIKPSNVLIQPTRDGVQAQLADFGIGQVTERERLAAAGITVLGTGETIFETASSGVSGTRLYMAPELLEGRAPTLQADIYALGVVLYQLVVGDLGRALAPGWRRDIDDELLAMDIACFVDRSPRRRPASALEVAERLRTIEERRRDHRAAAEARQATEASKRRRSIYKSVAVTALVALVLVSGVAVWALRASEEERRAHESTEQILGFMISLFEITDPYSQVSPGARRGETITALEILDRGTERLDGELEGEPLIRARLMDTFGNIYRSLGLYDQAQPLLEESLDTRRRLLGEHPDVASSTSQVGRLLHSKGDHAGALIAHRESLDLRRRLLGPEHPSTLMSMNHVARALRLSGRYAEACALHVETLEIQERVLGAEHPDTVDTMGNLAVALYYHGDFEGARQFNQRKLDIQMQVLGPEHPETVWGMNNLSMSLEWLGRYDEAKALIREVLDIRRRVLGDEHPDTLWSMTSLAMIHVSMGHYIEGKKLYEQALDAKVRVLGDEHVFTMWAMSNLSRALALLGEDAEARALQERALGHWQRSSGTRHPGSLWAMNNLASILQSAGEHAAAEDLQRQALELWHGTFGAQYPETLAGTDTLADILRSLGELGEAKTLQEENLNRWEGYLGASHPNTLRSVHGLARTHWRMGDTGAARSLALRAVEGREVALGPRHPSTTESILLLLNLARAEHDAEAVVRWRERLRWLADRDVEDLQGAVEQEARGTVLELLADPRTAD